MVKNIDLLFKKNTWFENDANKIRKWSETDPTIRKQCSSGPKAIGNDLKTSGNKSR